mgnify:CR=1 FL=1
MATQLDKEGFVINLDEWSPAVADDIASREGIVLTPAHWEILNEVRRYHDEFGLSPINRTLVKRIASLLGPDKGNSIYLLGLFPGSPARLACKIAGLPKPTNCL